MGRRSVHTPEELRELIIQAATEIVQQHGLEGLSAREIAKKIGYSPGTIYNVFENLDDLLLTIESRLLDQLAERLASTDPTGTPQQRVRRLAGSYYAFTQESPKLWNLLVEHRIPAGREVPEWYRTKLESLQTQMEEALTPLVGTTDVGASKRAARTLWASVHGMAALSTAHKLSQATDQAANGKLIDELVSTYLVGLEHRGVQ